MTEAEGSKGPDPAAPKHPLDVEAEKGAKLHSRITRNRLAVVILGLFALILGVDKLHSVYKDWFPDPQPPKSPVVVVTQDGLDRCHEHEFRIPWSNGTSQEISYTCGGATYWVSTFPGTKNGSLARAVKFRGESLAGQKGDCVTVVENGGAGSLLMPGCAFLSGGRNVVLDGTNPSETVVRWFPPPL